MGIFNIFKRKKQASREQLLEENRDSQELSSDDDSLSYQYNLSQDHKNDDNNTVISEGAMSDGNHKNSEESEVSLEKRMSDASNKGMYAHKNDGKEYSAMDISIASEKSDREFRDAYVKAEDKLTDKKNIFTAMSGMQLEREPQMVSGNVPLKNSGLNVAPERFEDFGETPGPDAKDNLKNYGKNPKITPMKFASTKTPEEMLLMIRDADAMSLVIKTQAIRNGKVISEEESSQLSQLRSAKAMIVESLRIKKAQEEIGMSHEMLDRLIGQEEQENEHHNQEEINNFYDEESQLGSEELDKWESEEFEDETESTEDDVSVKIEEINERLKSILGD